MKKIFSKRSLLGAIFLLVFIGEATIPQANGLYTLPGFVTLFFLYFTLFHLFESLTVRYKLVLYQIILLTFVIYSVLVTGFLHKELTEYVVSQDYLIVTLIRIQASLFTVFALYLLNKIVPRQADKVLSVKSSAVLFSLFVTLMSLTGNWGIPLVLTTLSLAPLHSALFITLSVIALYKIFKERPEGTSYSNKIFTILAAAFLIVGLTPLLPSLFFFLIGMPVVIALFFRDPGFRRAAL